MQISSSPFGRSSWGQTVMYFLFYIRDCTGRIRSEQITILEENSEARWPEEHHRKNATLYGEAIFIPGCWFNESNLYPLTTISQKSWSFMDGCQARNRILSLLEGLIFCTSRALHRISLFVEVVNFTGSCHSKTYLNMQILRDLSNSKTALLPASPQQDVLNNKHHKSLPSQFKF